MTDRTIWSSKEGADEETAQTMGGAERAKQGPGTQGSHQTPPQSWQILLPTGKVDADQLATCI